MFLVNYHYGKDLVRDVFGSKNLRNTFITSLIGCVGIVVTCLFCNCLLHSMIWKTFFSILLSSVVYILILILLRNAFAVSLLKQLREVLQTYLQKLGYSLRSDKKWNMLFVQLNLYIMSIYCSKSSMYLMMILHSLYIGMLNTKFLIYILEIQD